MLDIYAIIMYIISYSGRRSVISGAKLPSTAWLAAGFC